MPHAYEHYFESKHYDQRYPKPNLRTMNVVARLVPPDAPILDIGAGNGRYAIPLAERGHSVIAVERSEKAREQLTAAAQVRGLAGRIACYRDLCDIEEEALGQCKIGLLLFGVLGHMRFDERQVTLNILKATMPCGARLLGSVPNRLRRFAREQQQTRVNDVGRAPRFTYTRIFGGAENVFEYTAYTPSELRGEFIEHGWECISIRPESILSESTVARHCKVAALDGMVTDLLPPAFGYGLLFHIRKFCA